MLGGGFETIMLAHLMSHKGFSDTSVADNVNFSAQAATYGGAATSVLASQLSLPEWLAICSTILAALGFLVQVALAIRMFRRDAREARYERDARRTQPGD